MARVNVPASLDALQGTDQGLVIPEFSVLPAES